MRNSHDADTMGAKRAAGLEVTSTNTKSTKQARNENSGFTPLSERESTSGKLNTVAYHAFSGGAEVQRGSLQRQGQYEAHGDSEDGGQKYYQLGNSSQSLFKGQHPKLQREAGTPLSQAHQSGHSLTPSARSKPATGQ